MFLIPDWPAPKHIKALCTTREGGRSLPPFESFNLALHVGDDPEDVEWNRQQLSKQAQLPSTPFWLDQQHTDVAIELRHNSIPKISPPPIADASWTTQKGCVSIVMTADCLPLLITNKQGTLVSAIHAGWKGLHLGIVTKTITEVLLKEKSIQAEDLLVWIGPAISAKHFEVGQDVLDSFVRKESNNRAFFTEIAPQYRSISEPKYLADLVGMVRQELNNMGVTEVFGGEFCTYAQSDLFYSYRRSGKTGRIASCIWIQS